MSPDYGASRSVAMGHAERISTQSARMARRVVAWAMAYIEERRRYRRTLDELERLTDNELADVGLRRDEICHVARLCAERR